MSEPAVIADFEARAKRKMGQVGRIGTPEMDHRAKAGVEGAERDAVPGAGYFGLGLVNSSFIEHPRLRTKDALRMEETAEPT